MTAWWLNPSFNYSQGITEQFITHKLIGNNIVSSKGFKFQNDLFLIHNCWLSYTQCGPMTCIQNVTVTENDERKSDKNYL